MIFNFIYMILINLQLLHNEIIIHIKDFIRKKYNHRMYIHEKIAFLQSTRSKVYLAL